MWHETNVDIKLVVDGSPLSMPAIESRNGVKLTLKGFSRDLQKLFTYSDNDIDLELQGIRYDENAERLSGHFKVWLSTSLKAHRNRNQGPNLLDIRKQRKIKEDLPQAIPLWKLFLARDEPSIRFISYS